MRESADGDRWQRCPSSRGSAAGGRWYGAYPLSTRQVEALMEDRGRGSTPAPPVGHPVQPAAGGGMPPAPAPGVGPWAEGCNRHEGPRPVALSGAGGGQTRPDHGLAAYRASDTAAARRLLKQASRRHGLPRRCPWTVAPPRPPRSRERRGTRPLSASGRQDCHTVVEQEHRAVQRVTRPMVGGKACAAAQDPLGGWNSCP